jgi:hypothetical protein
MAINYISRLLREERIHAIIVVICARPKKCGIRQIGLIFIFDRLI